MPILRLPNELLTQIAQAIKRLPALHSLCLTKKRLYTVTNPILYRRDVLLPNQKGKPYSSTKALLHTSLQNSINIARYSLSAGANLHFGYLVTFEQFKHLHLHFRRYSRYLHHDPITRYHSSRLSALQIAILSGSQSVALFLLDAGALRRARNFWIQPGTTLVHLACSLGLLNVVKTLAFEGMRLDVRDTEGSTPLRYAREGIVVTPEREALEGKDRRNKFETINWLLGRLGPDIGVLTIYQKPSCAMVLKRGRDSLVFEL